MFERMADAGRRVLVLAQEESCLAGHGHIGTEHLLLGLLSVPVTSDLLEAVGIALDPMREQVSRTLSPHLGGPGSPAFTPRAKKVLELSLREALDRQSPSIGPGDILLGVLREGEGVATQLLVGQGVDLVALRQRVLERLEGEPPSDPQAPVDRFGVASRSVRPPGRLGGRVFPGQRPDACVVCGRDTWEVDHFVTDGSVLLCQVCIDDAAGAIRDAAPDQHRISLPPRVFGTVPSPEAPGAIAEAVARVTGPEPEGGWGPFLEDAAEIREALHEAQQRSGSTGAQAIVRRVRFVSDEHAWILLTVHLGPSLGGFPFEGPVKRIDGSWKVSRELVATMLGAAGIQLPPPT
jgi:hypothetical protein